MTDASKQPRGSIAIVLVAILAAVIGLSGLIGAGGLIWAQGKIDERPKVVLADSPSPGAPDVLLGGECEETCNFLVLGSDSRSGLSNQDQQGFGTDEEIEGYRSDTMLLVNINGETRQSTIISFPRDTLVEIPGVAGLEGYGDKNLINAAFAEGASGGGGEIGGAKKAAETVASLTGLRIQHVIVVDLAAFKAVVDAVGTVPFCTPVPMRDDPAAFPDSPPGVGGSGLNMPHAGCYDLTGDDALALVRARYVVAGGSKDCISDYARIARQQQFMRAMLNKLLSPGIVTKVPAIVEAVTKEVTHDDGLKVVDLLDLASAMQGVSSGNADFRTLPTTLDPQNVHLEITPDGRRFLDKLRNGEPLGDLGTELDYQPPAPAEIAVRVFDDVSGGHAQGDVYDAQLSRSGFKMLATRAELAGEALTGRGTVILYAKGHEDDAKVLSGYVPGVEIAEAKPGELPEDTDVGVVVDATYEYKDPGEGTTETVEEKCPFT